MKEAKAIDALTKIFHVETYTGGDGNYELSSNSWGLNFNVRIREYTIFIQDGKGARCSIDSDEDVDTMCQEIVAFIGEVIKDESRNYTFEGRSQILAWPYNCNTYYVDYLKTAFDMNPEEDEFDYAKRKRGVTNSRKLIKSSLRKENMDLYLQYRDDIFHAINEVDKKYNMSGVGPFSTKEDFDEVIEWMDTHDYWAEPDEGEYDEGEYDDTIESSMQGQERGIQAIMDEYGCTREEAIDIMNSEVTSGCHGKAKKKNKKEIKSSLVDEFEEKYSEASNEWSDEECNTCRDSFLNDFAKDHGITYDETKKMLDELEDKWYKDADNAGIVDIYSSTRRNVANLNRIFK